MCIYSTYFLNQYLLGAEVWVALILQKRISSNALYSHEGAAEYYSTLAPLYLESGAN